MTGNSREDQLEAVVLAYLRGPDAGLRERLTLLIADVDRPEDIGDEARRQSASILDTLDMARADPGAFHLDELVASIQDARRG